jgi:hypothetical protein
MRDGSLGPDFRHDAMPSDDADARDERLLNDDATSVLVGFATGGLIGALQALERDPWDESDSPGVEDPDALRRAEEAVAGERSPWLEPRLTAGEGWAPIAKQVGQAFVGGLQEVAVALHTAGIPVGWDPYDPREAPNFLPPLLGTPGRTFVVLVPASRLRDAREAVGDLRPEDVTFLWPEAGAPIETLPVRETIEAERAAREAEEASDYDEKYGFAGGDPSSPKPVTSYDGLSDNARLQNMAQGRGTGCALGLVVLVGAAVVGAAFLLFAGMR